MLTNALKQLILYICILGLGTRPPVGLCCRSSAVPGSDWSTVLQTPLKLLAVVLHPLYYKVYKLYKHHLAFSGSGKGS